MVVNDALVKELSFYQVIDEKMLERVKKLPERFTFKIRDQILKIGNFLGMGSIGMVFEATLDDKPVVAKFLGSNDNSSGPQIVLRGNIAAWKLCRSGCESMVKILSVLQGKEVSSGDFHKIIILEKGEETAQSRLLKLFISKDFEKLNELLYQLVMAAMESFKTFRQNLLCHMDADISNFIVFKNSVKLGDFDLVSGKKGNEFNLPERTTGKPEYLPPEHAMWDHVCRDGYDPFYFAYSLAIKMAEFYNIQLSRFNHKSLAGDHKIPTRVKIYRDFMFESIEKILERFKNDVKSFLKKKYQIDDSDQRLLKATKTIRILKRMLAVDPRMRTIEQ